MKGAFENSSSYIKLCILALVFFASAIVATLLSAIYTAATNNPQSTESLRLLLLIQNSLLFIATPLIAQYFLWSKPTSVTLHFNKPKPSVLLLGCAAIIVSSPLIDALTTWNQGLHLPESLQTIEQWMISSEKQAEAITKQILHIHNWEGFAMNILVIAILAGVGEELLFRGVLQKIFIDWTKNIHIGIWITAFIFSAIHLQFFGFVPRLILGALLGYLFVWSKSLWVPILAHTLNNALVIVFTSDAFNKANPWIETVEKANNSYRLILLSVILLTLCMWRIKVINNKV